MKRRNNYLDKNISIHLLLLCKISQILMKNMRNWRQFWAECDEEISEATDYEKEITILSLG